MALPQDLIDEFASITYDESTKKDETTCYGKAVFRNDQSYVQLDGATTLTPATFAVNAVEGDRVLVRIKNHKALVTANITSPSMTLSLLKVNTGIIVEGYLTTNSKRLEYDDQANKGLTFSGGGIGAYGGSGKYWYVTNDGDLYASSAEIVGKITASSGFIGSPANGFHIDEYGFYSGSKSGTTSGYITLSNSDFSRQINDVNHSDLRFAIGSKFGVASDGTVYSSAADISGKITAMSGYLGTSDNGFQIDQYGIYSKAKGDATSGSIALSNGDFTRVINNKSHSDLRFAIGGKFGVANDGTVYASSASISGEVIAESGYLGTSAGGFHINQYGIYSKTDGDNTSGSISLSNNDFTRRINNVQRDGLRFAIGSNFGVASNGKLYASSVDVSGKITAETGKIGDFDIGTGIYSNNKASIDSTRSGVFIGTDGIALGASSPFRVTSEGYLYASNADVKGNITATTLKIGYNDVNLYAEENGLLVRDGEREIARFGIDGQTFKNELSQSIFKVGYLPEQIGKSTRIFTKYDGVSNELVITLPWMPHENDSDDPTITFSAWYSDRKTLVRINVNELSYTINDNVVTFGSEACTVFKQNNVAYISCTYTPYGAFPYYTFGDEFDGGDVGPYSVREGVSNIASGYASHVEGMSSIASDDFSHAEGESAIASGASSHAEGAHTTASGYAAHAEGAYTTADGDYAHASGYGTIAHKYQTVVGNYNTGKANDGYYDYVFIIGNGGGHYNRSDALTVDFGGNVEIKGTIKSMNGGLLPEEEYTLDPISIPTGQMTSVLDVVVEPNSRNLIVYGAAFATNSTGIRRLHMASSGSTAGRFSPQVQATSSDQTRMNASLVYANSSSSSLTLHLWAYQNSGGDLNVWPYAYVVQI